MGSANCLHKSAVWGASAGSLQISTFNQFFGVDTASVTNLAGHFSNATLRPLQLGLVPTRPYLFELGDDVGAA